MGTVITHGRRILLSSVSSDSHTWNLVFLQMLLQEAGHEVVNLGPCVPAELLVDTARRVRPDAIVISTVNGHGHLDGAHAIRALRSHPDTSRIPAIIGGKLGIPDGAGADADAQALIEAGFDAVFTDSADASPLPRYLASLPASLPASRTPSGHGHDTDQDTGGESSA